MQDHDIDRRTFVAQTGAVTGALALAGCFGTDDENGDDASDDEADDVELPRFPEVEDPPNAVYVPTHRESMHALEPVEAGDYALAPMLSYPHPFWIVTGGDGDEDAVERVDPEANRGVHMMFTLWDDETGVVLPADTGTTVRISTGGERIGSPQSMWTMLSQGMGFHFGDNVPLGEDGTYTVDVELPPLSTPTTGDLEGRFTEGATATFEFEYEQAFRDEVVGGVEYFDEEYWGERGALEPMAHGAHDDGDGDDGHANETDDADDDRANETDDGHDDHDTSRVPYSQLPEVDAYPGTLLVEPDGDRADETRGLPRSGDAAFLAVLSDPGFRLADDDRYLLVSPRTPYNRVPLADMTLNVTIERDGESVADTPTSLEQTIDGEYGLHYGASVADVQPGDSVTITIDRPPQVARHQGYETAFLEMPPIELTVPEGEDR